MAGFNIDSLESDLDAQIVAANKGEGSEGGKGDDEGKGDEGGEGSPNDGGQNNDSQGGEGGGDGGGAFDDPSHDGPGDANKGGPDPQKGAVDSPQIEDLKERIVLLERVNKSLENEARHLGLTVKDLKKELGTKKDVVPNKDDSSSKETFEFSQEEIDVLEEEGVSKEVAVLLAKKFGAGPSAKTPLVDTESRDRLSRIEQKVLQDDGNTFKTELDKAVPGWQEINSTAKFENLGGCQQAPFRQ